MKKSEAPPKVLSVLAVDDTPANLTLLCSLLKDRGYRARPVPSGALALQAAAAEPPDLILLDISMPEMDGFEVCSRLKADPRLKEIPVIFLSAHTDVADKVKAFSMGGVDYVTKPFQFEEVQARVETHLELCRQRRELRQSYEALAELEKLRDSLVHMVVHDLRSPLASLVVLLELLHKENNEQLSPEICEDLEQATAVTRHLTDLVSQILDVSRLEAGRLAPELQEQDVSALVGAAICRLQALAGTRCVTLTPAAGPATAEVDGDLVTRVVQNLLSNAIRHTQPRGRIGVMLEADDAKVRVAIADDGAGIPREQQARIFEKFAQVEGDGRRRRVGTSGLGLTFCKLVVEAHGGQIGVESQEGQGSTFWFELPRARPR